MRHTVIEEPRTSLVAMRVSSRAGEALAVVVALVEPAVRVAQAALAALVELAAQEVRVELAVQVVLAGLGVRVAGKAGVAPVGGGVALAPVAAKPELDRVEARVLVQVAAPAKIKLVTAAHRHGQVPRLAAEEDLAAAAGTMRAPAATEVVAAWVAAVTAAAVAVE